MYGFEAVTFEGKRTARKALNTLEDYTPAYLWIDDTAVISRNEFGSINIQSTWAQNSGEAVAGMGFGALTGGLLGMLFGPGGAMFGAISGGGIGGLFGAIDNESFNDPRLDHFASTLADDTSALILVGEKATLLDFNSAIGPFGGEIVRSDLDEQDIKKIRRVLRDNR